MPKDSSYMEYIVYDVLGHIPDISAKSMFSGWGIYWKGVIVAIIADGELYFKADRDLVAKYKKSGLYPFTYKKGDGKSYDMAYMSVPEETLNDHDAIEERVFESYEISLKGKKKK